MQTSKSESSLAEPTPPFVFHQAATMVRAARHDALNVWLRALSWTCKILALQSPLLVLLSKPRAGSAIAFVKPLFQSTKVTRFLQSCKLVRHTVRPIKFV